MANIYVFANGTDPQTLSSAVDGKVGYPRAGVDVGGGLHVDAATGTTVRYGNVLKHPTLAQWAYPADGIVLANAVSIQASLTFTLPAPVTADATWNGATTANAVP